MKTNRQPFQDIIDTALFFGGGARREIVENIKTALADEVQLLTLTGTDGSGKTMICRMVQQELQGSAEVLILDRGAESFDEVVNLIAAQVELEESEEISDRNTRLEKAVEILHQQNRRLIIILDGAEKIFLATLERIRRMIDQVNDPQLCIQLLFSGRPLFSLNYKQLLIINFKVVEERHFSLDPLDGKDTHLYLNHCLDHSATDEQKRFSLIQAEEIADIARGNFRLINQLAGRFLDLKRLAGEKQDTGEYEFAEGDSSVEQSRLTTGLANVDLDFLKVPKIGARWYAAGAGLVALVLLIILLRGGEEKEVEPLPQAEEVPELTLEKVEPDPIDIPEPSLPVEPLQPPSRTLTPEEQSFQVAEKVEPDPVDIPEPSLPAEPLQLPSPEAAPEEPQPTVAQDRPLKDVLEEAEDSPEPLSPGLIEEQAESSIPAVPRAAEIPAQEPSAPEATADSETVAEQTESEMAADIPPAEVKEEESVIVEAAPASPREESAVTETYPALEESTEPPIAEAVEDQVEPDEKLAATENLSEEPPKAETQDSREASSIPKLTVLPKKKPLTEPEPLQVVTLKDESKTSPERPTPPASVPEPAPAPPQAAPLAAEGIQLPVAAQPEVEPETTEPPQERFASIDWSEEDVAAASARRSGAPVTGTDSSVYYAQRLAAGSRWLVGGSRDKFTVQLMVLDSEDAQQNVRYMLAEEDYRQVLEQLYILRKVGQPQTVMLYWGEFDSPAEARAARSQLPNFLSRLEPFEIPVKDAVAKARAGQ